MLILVALVVAVIIKTFLVQAFYIPSASMEETLLINDRVMVNKLAYAIGEIERGHIIVFDDPRRLDNGTTESVPARVVRNLAESIGLSTPQSEFIKRVIAIPGDTVEVRGGLVYLNGTALDEPYVPEGTSMPALEPVTIPPGHVFVMGDNRDVSQDSRVPEGADRMAEEDLERYETDVELRIYKEYRDVLPLFRYVVETERRFYLANDVALTKHGDEGSVYFELQLEDAWVWDMYRPARFVKSVKVMTFRDVNIEELEPTSAI